MVDATTANVLLTVPARGADTGTWDVPVNGNSNALDGFLGGVATVSLTNAPVTLTAPSGSVTPTGGPFQSQNRILKFTGALSGNCQITLPLPGEYTIQNLTTGNFVVSFIAAGAGKVIATPQGSVMNIWNDGTDCWLVKNQIPGELKFLGGISAVPSWISACTLAPYLLCDGSVYNYSTYTALGNLYGGNFGGNGITTFGVQDLQGRVPLAYDGTGTRITSAGCGINGQTLGASGGAQTETLTLAQLPTGITSTGTVTDNTGYVRSGSTTGGGWTDFSASLGGSGVWRAASPGSNFADTAAPTATGTFTSNNTGGAAHPIVQPAQVAGIWLVAT